MTILRIGLSSPKSCSGTGLTSQIHVWGGIAKLVDGCAMRVYPVTIDTRSVTDSFDPGDALVGVQKG
jgi:hypothetical protein